LALYRAGQGPYIPAQGFFGPCGSGNQIQTEYIYPSCTLVSSVQNQICAQTYSYPTVGPFRYSHSPILIGNYTNGFAQPELAYNLYTSNYWKVEGFPDPECGTNVDYGVFGVSFTTPPCRDSVGCCP
jgi:hypothetical protein